MKLLILCLLVISGLNVQAQDAGRGQSLYAKCISCHGNKGEGKKSMKAPRIGGQHDWYIVTALNDFKAKKRKNPTMLPFIKNLNEQDFKDLAAYIAKLK